jgi:diadenosine tetraphosphate (Ap4A) HIT family hydrolase
MPSLGQITEGHLLVAPVRHYLSLADIPSAHRGELEALLTKARDILRAAYGSCISFEHGVRSGSGGCGISHAHMHLVPIAKAEVFFDRLRSAHRFAQVSGVTAVDAHLDGSPYLFVENVDGFRYAAAVGPIPSQYLRKSLAAVLENASWDWRDTGIERSLIATTRRLSKPFTDPPKSRA